MTLNNKPRSDLTLWLAGAGGILLLVAVVGLVNRQDNNNPPSGEQNTPSREMPKDSGIAVAPAQAMADMQPGASAPVQNNGPTVAVPDPFKAFLEASKNHQVPAAVNQAPMQAGKDPFKAALEASQKQAPASPAYPFAR